MPRLVFHPFNQEGELVKRGVTSMRASATRDDVIEKVKYTVARPGIGLIVHVEVRAPDGSLSSSWDARYGGIVQQDGVGSEDWSTAFVRAVTNVPKPQEVKMAEAAAKKPAEKPKTETPPRVERNGVTAPKVGGRMEKAWDFLSSLDASKDHNWQDLEKSITNKGLTVGGVRAEYPNWRKFHGVTFTIGAKPKAPKTEKPAKTTDNKPAAGAGGNAA